MIRRKISNAAGNPRSTFLAALIIIIFPAFVYCLTVTSATLEINADDEFAAYINGSLVFDTGTISGSDWQNTYKIDVSSFLFCGDYVLAVNYYDTLGSMMSLTYKLTLHLDDGSTVLVETDGINQKQILDGNFLSGTQTFPAGWNSITFDDSGWTNPVYTCTGTRVTDTAYTSGFVPFIAPYTGCYVATTGQSVLERQKFSILCPLVNITKSESKSIVTLGDTITYCFNYNNTDAAPWTFNIWDTIPAVTDFVGCDHGCTTQTAGSSVLVVWPVTVTPGGSGSVCAWVAANRYPMLLEMEKLCVLPPEDKGKAGKIADAGRPQ
jgi:uncharacterized repeat protein (TIGR01451 family)